MNENQIVSTGRIPIYIPSNTLLDVGTIKWFTVGENIFVFNYVNDALQNKGSISLQIWFIFRKYWLLNK